MITNEEFWILGVGFTCLMLAYVLLKSPDAAVQRARLFTAVCAAGSIVTGLLGWLMRQVEARPGVVGEVASAVVPLAIGVGVGVALWFARGRLRPRGFQKRVTLRRAWVPASDAKRYEGYRKVAK